MICFTVSVCLGSSGSGDDSIGNYAGEGDNKGGGSDSVAVSKPCKDLIYRLLVQLFALSLGQNQDQERGYNK